MRVRAASSLLVLALGCAGGGGGGPSAPQPAFTPATVTLDVIEGERRPFTLSASFGQRVDVLNVKIVSDVVGEFTGTSITFPGAGSRYESYLVLTQQLAPGTHAGHIAYSLCRDSASVCSNPYPGAPWMVPYQITVRPRHTANRILASRTGVALTKTPGWSRLARTVTMRSSLGQLTPWTASSDRQWLSVTAAGTTGAPGDVLTLTADPAGLPVDEVSRATVTVTPDDASVPPEEIRVALWVGSATPASIAEIGTGYSVLVSSPTAPYLYAHARGTSIDVLNAYTGAKVGTLTSVGTVLAGMVVSSDGRTLFVRDPGARAISVVDLDAGTVRSTWALPSGLQPGPGLQYLRPSGREALLVDSAAYSADGVLLTADSHIRSPITAAADDGERVYTINAGVSPAWVDGYEVDVADDGTFVAVPRPMFDLSSWGLANGRDIAVSGDGAHVYTASGAPYACLRIDPAVAGSVASLAAPPGSYGYVRGVEVGSDGRVYCAARVESPKYADELRVHAADGTLLVSYDVPSPIDELAITADGLLAAVRSSATLKVVPVGP